MLHHAPDETSAAFVAVLPTRLQLRTLKQGLRRDSPRIYASLSDLVCLFFMFFLVLFVLNVVL